MIHSLKRYIRFFFVTIFGRKEKLILLNHWVDYYVTKTFLRTEFSTTEKEKALQLNIEWLLSAKQSGDGMGTYYITDGWTSPYPETTGYIIPTLSRYAYYFPGQKSAIHQHILDAADWLVKIQKPSGGWQSGYIHQNRTE